MKFFKLRVRKFHEPKYKKNFSVKKHKKFSECFFIFLFLFLFNIIFFFQFLELGLKSDPGIPLVHY